MTLDDGMTARQFVQAQHERDQATAYAEWQEQRELESVETMEALWARRMAFRYPPHVYGVELDRPGLDRRHHPIDGDTDRD